MSFAQFAAIAFLLRKRWRLDITRGSAQLQRDKALDSVTKFGQQGLPELESGTTQALVKLYTARTAIEVSFKVDGEHRVRACLDRSVTLGRIAQRDARLLLVAPPGSVASSYKVVS